MKKILLLTAGTGEGQAVIARNVSLALHQVAGDQVKVETFDLVQSVGESMPNFLRPMFQINPLREALRDLLWQREPDLVFATASIYGDLIGQIYQGGRVRDFVLVAWKGSLLGSEIIEAKMTGDFLVVMDGASAEILQGRSVPRSRIKILGFPVSPASPYPVPAPARVKQKRILCLLDGLGKKAPKLLERLLEHLDWDITVFCDDPARARAAETLAATAPKRMRLLSQRPLMASDLRNYDITIGQAESGWVHESIAASCPFIAYRARSAEEKANLRFLREANAGVLAEKPREVIDWLERAFHGEDRLLDLWRKNLAALQRPNATLDLARFLLDQADLPPLAVPTFPPPVPARKSRRLPKKLLMCDLHTHTTWSDGKLTVPALVDFYGQRGFDCLCITDHLCDPKRLLGKLVNLTGLVIPPGKTEAYFAAVEPEKKRAREQYDLLLMTGIEFNKDGYTPKTSTHLLGIDLKQPIDPSLGLKELIAEIHAQGGLAIASHPHETKGTWGKDTLYLWENVNDYSPLIDAWEIANRDDLFNPVGLKKLPFIASSDFHKPKHIQSWKTVLYCEKEAEAIKHCVRVNRDVSLTLYRDHRFGLEDRGSPLIVHGEFDGPKLMSRQG